jgi:Spy/CpxP family protein refolding chaperone
MNRTRKILSAVLVLAVLATGALTLTAFRYHHRDPARFDRFVANRVEDMLDDVKATDAQRQQIQAVVDKVVADGKALRASHADMRSELLAQWQSDQPDAARVHALIDARADTMKKFADEVADAVLQVHGILTPEQRAIVTKKLQRHMQEHVQE